MGFPVQDAQLTASDWQYFNQRTSEMGLDQAGIDAHGIQYTLHARLWDFGIRSKLTQLRNAILFPYIDEEGRKLDFFQARMIGEAPDDLVPPKGLTPEQYRKLLKDQWPKYLNGKRFDLYFPIIPSPWHELETLFITEGIPKAIRACRAGIPCASIQGKDMFVLKQSNILVPALERALQWPNLKQIIYIADSDASSNEGIRNAAIRLCGLINGRKQSRDFAKFAILPGIPDYDKTGLDDYLNSKGVNELLTHLPTWLHAYEGGRYFEMMDKLNAKLYLVSGTTNFIDRDSRQVISSAAAMALVSPVLFNIGTVVVPYSGRTVRAGNATLANTFVADPDRNIVDGVDFWPGMEEILPGNKFNLWTDCSPEEIAGDVEPFLKLLEVAIPNENERDLLLQLVAHRIHRPQDKAPLMIFLYGGEGTGKSTLAIACGAAITSNPDYVSIGGMNLTYSHEDRHGAKEFVCLEEPTKSGMTNSDMESMFKLLGDNETIYINPKNIQGYNVKNRILLWINSNDHFLPVSGAARRWLMIKSTFTSNAPEAQACRKWMETDNYGGKLRHYLRNKYPEVNAFELQLAAAQAISKKEIVADNRPPMLNEYEEFLGEQPLELVELGYIPTRILMASHPYSMKDVRERSAVGRVLGKEYALAKLDSNSNSQMNVPKVAGATTTFRSTKSRVSGILTMQEARDIYEAWANHPTIKIRSKI